MRVEGEREKEKKVFFHTFIITLNLTKLSSTEGLKEKKAEKGKNKKKILSNRVLSKVVIRISVSLSDSIHELVGGIQRLGGL